MRRFLLKIAIRAFTGAGRLLCRVRIASPLVLAVEAKLFEIRWRYSRPPGPQGGALKHLFQKYEPGASPAKIYREIFSPARYKAGYYSQFGQDLFLNRWFFKNHRAGAFVDVGAYDGITGSNTYYFERQLGWRGVAIEANPEAVAKLVQNRTCEVFDGCAYDHDGTVEFVMLTEPAKLAAKRPLLEPRNTASIVFDGRHAGTMLSGIGKHLQEQGRMSRSEREHQLHRTEHKAKCCRVDTILRRLEMHVVDFLDIDVEGAECEVLKGVDFRKFHVNVISIEWNPRFSEVYALLTEAGFEYQGLLMYDEIFTNKTLQFSWER
jgi:FkbM family methyltransferase